ncbi:ATP-binding protein [Rickettsiales bacterium]|nr:ATP-binding protein [Rickettsiales bacterium]
MENSSDKFNDLSKEELLKKLICISEDFELFAHLASHELKDPLRQAIIYCNEYIEDQSGKNISKISDVIKCNETVIKRVEILRKYSHLVNYKENKESVDCNAILAKVTEDLKDLINLRKAEIRSDKLPTIKANEDQILILFSSMIDNAIKFCPEKPPIIDIGVKDEGSHFQFYIKDNGIGLDHLYRKLVFSLLQRLTPEIEDGSMGAGLAFAKKIVENHGGKIWYESEEDLGTCFYFTIAK